MATFDLELNPADSVYTVSNKPLTVWHADSGTGGPLTFDVSESIDLSSMPPVKQTWAYDAITNQYFIIDDPDLVDQSAVRTAVRTANDHYLRSPDRKIRFRKAAARINSPLRTAFHVGPHPQ